MHIYKREKERKKKKKRKEKENINGMMEIIIISLPM